MDRLRHLALGPRVAEKQGQTTVFRLTQSVAASARKLGRLLLLSALLAAPHAGAGGSPELAAFDGTWRARFPERIGQPEPTQEWTLVCDAGACALSAGEARHAFRSLEPAQAEHVSQARQALRYARERKENGRVDAPYLAPLLDADSDLAECIDLGSPRDERGLTLLCTVERNPWDRPVVLLLGTILASCGRAFCRFEFFPLFAR